MWIYSCLLTFRLVSTTSRVTSLVFKLLGAHTKTDKPGGPQIHFLSSQPPPPRRTSYHHVPDARVPSQFFRFQLQAMARPLHNHKRQKRGEGRNVNKINFVTKVHLYFFFFTHNVYNHIFTWYVCQAPSTKRSFIRWRCLSSIRFQGA